MLIYTRNCQTKERDLTQDLRAAVLLFLQGSFLYCFERAISAFFPLNEHSTDFGSILVREQPYGQQLLWQEC